MRRTTKLLATALLSATVHLSATAANYTPVTFDAPGSTNTSLWDISSNGTMVGVADAGGFVYSGGSFNYLPGHNGLTPSALGISDAGVVVGGLLDAGTGAEIGYVYAEGSYSTITVPGATLTEARHISADGRWVAGYYQSDTIEGGFVLDRSTNAMTLVPVDATLNFMILQGADSAGLVVGSITGSGDDGVLYDAPTGTTTLVPSVSGITGPHFRDINEAGLIVGYAGASALVGSMAGGFQLFALPGSTLTVAEGLNETGTIVGQYTDSSGVAHGFIAAVPEPATALLLAGGLAVVVSLRRRQRRLR